MSNAHAAFLVRALATATLLSGLAFTVFALVHEVTGGSAALSQLATVAFCGVFVLGALTVGAVVGAASRR